jgi:hypothetical protein
MGSVVNQISSGWHMAGEMLNNATNTRVGDLAFSDVFWKKPPSEAPPPPEQPGVQEVLTAQQQNAKDFRSSMPKMQSQMQQDLAQQNNRNMLTDQRNIETKNNQRGLLYGGMNAADKASSRTQHRGLLASSIGSVNTGLSQAADELDAQAIDTATGVQRSKQDIENSVYNSAMAKLNADNAQTGGLIGMVGSMLAM